MLCEWVARTQGTPAHKRRVLSRALQESGYRKIAAALRLPLGGATGS